MPKQAYPTMLHNAFVDVGIPAITPEIGAARVLDVGMIPLFVEGTMNVLKHYGIVAGPMGRTAKDVTVLIENSGFPLLATKGGLSSIWSNSTTRSSPDRRSPPSATVSAK